MNVQVTIETVEDLSLDRFVGCILDTLSLEIQEVIDSYTKPGGRSEGSSTRRLRQSVAEKIPLPWPDWEPPDVMKGLYSRGCLKS